MIYKNQENKLKYKKQILIIVLIIIVVVSSVGYERLKDKQIHTITLEELKDVFRTDFQTPVYVYIGRESCPTCNVFYPTLCNISKRKKMKILYYNTEHDRNERALEMQDFLNEIGVESVPIIIKIESSVIVERYNDNEFIENFT